jgi:hypothetical protein
VTQRHSNDSEHEIVYFAGPMSGNMPTPRKFFNALPAKVQAKLSSILIAVAAAPPGRFAGGGYWEAMHGAMSGFYEIRADFQRTHYRLICLLDYEAIGPSVPLLVIVAGLSKPVGTTIKPEVYAHVKSAGLRYLSVNPRAIE